MSRFIVFLAAFASVCSAQQPSPDAPKLPDEASRLKQTYQQDLERAAQPIRERYLFNLKRLLDNATRDGKLNDALAIKTELDAAAASDGIDSVQEFERKFTALKWAWNGAFGMNFKPDGTADRGLTWKSVKPFTIEYKYPDGNHGTIVFERNLSRAAIYETTPSGKKGTLALIRAKD
jgi:hypothetical protein